MDVKRIINALLWGSVFIAVGCIWLLDSLNIINIDIGRLWPAIFIVIGLSIIIDGILKGTDEKN